MLLSVLALRDAGAAAAGAVVLEVLGNPVPKARVRVPYGNRGRYTPSDADERALARSMRYAYRGRPLEGPIAAAFLFVRSDRRPCDTDNLTKLAKDAGTGITWKDDAQIEWEISGVEVGADARTVIAFASLPHSESSRYAVAPRKVAVARQFRGSSRGALA